MTRGRALVSKITDSKAERRQRDRLPRNRQRERVLQLVRANSEPIDAAELASRMGLHVTTVRFHLDALCDEGSVERTRKSRDGVGRPRTGYRAVEGRLDYRMLAEVLAMELGRTVEVRARRAQRIGVQWAARIVGSGDTHAEGERDTGAVQESSQLERAGVLAADVFDRMGFDPELVAESAPLTSLPVGEHQIVGRERIIRLHDCPVRDFARSHPEVGCGIHRGLLQGLLDHVATTEGGAGARSEALSARLDPFVETELCVARLGVSRRRTAQGT